MWKTTNDLIRNPGIWCCKSTSVTRSLVWMSIANKRVSFYEELGHTHQDSCLCRHLKAYVNSGHDVTVPHIESSLADCRRVRERTCKVDLQYMVKDPNRLSTVCWASLNEDYHLSVSDMHGHGLLVHNSRPLVKDDFSSDSISTT